MFWKILMTDYSQQTTMHKYKCWLLSSKIDYIYHLYILLNIVCFLKKSHCSIPTIWVHICYWINKWILFLNIRYLVIKNTFILIFIYVCVFICEKDRERKIMLVINKWWDRISSCLWCFSEKHLVWNLFCRPPNR